MAVPYSDPNAPYTRKCAFDVGGEEADAPWLPCLGPACGGKLPRQPCMALSCGRPQLAMFLLGCQLPIPRSDSCTCLYPSASCPWLPDYGLGNCANSLELGCDCLGNIHYFDGVLNNSKGMWPFWQRLRAPALLLLLLHRSIQLFAVLPGKGWSFSYRAFERSALPLPRRKCWCAAGEPVLLKKAVCMHEEDAGILWKHSEYRTGYAEVRRWALDWQQQRQQHCMRQFCMRAGCLPATSVVLFYVLAKF